MRKKSHSATTILWLLSLLLDPDLRFLSSVAGLTFSTSSSSLLFPSTTVPTMYRPTSSSSKRRKTSAHGIGASTQQTSLEQFFITSSTTTTTITAKRESTTADSDQQGDHNIGTTETTQPSTMPTTTTTTTTSSSTTTTRMDVDPPTKEPQNDQRTVSATSPLPDVKPTAADTATTTTTTTPSSSSSIPSIPTLVPYHRHARWDVYEQACIRRTWMGSDPNASSNRIAAFDLDGTLLEWRIHGWPSRMDQYQLWNSHVITKLRDLYDTQQYQLVIFSNQGAIRSAFTGKKATLVKNLIEWLAHCVDRPIRAIMSTNKKNGYHKPSVRLWQAASESFWDGDIDRSASFYVGDSADEDDPQGGVDRLFARNIGTLLSQEQGEPQQSLRFYTPEEYFGPSQSANQSMGLGGGSNSQAPPATALVHRASLHSGTLKGPLLLLLCGAQGSGKSTFCQKLGNGWVALSQDTIRNGKAGTREQVEQAAQDALRGRQCVVIDRMHLDMTQREYFITIGKECQVPVHCLVLRPPTKIIMERVRQRENHMVTGEKGAQMASRSALQLQMPSYDEGFDLISCTGCRMDSFARLYRAVADGTLDIPQSFELGDTRVILPSIALGTMNMKEKALGMVLSGGFTAIDTAPTYKNEHHVGTFIGGQGPIQPFCIVKVPKRATTAAQVRQELNDSLTKLQVKHADLLLLHWPCDADALNEIWQAMETCHHEGLARSLGVCNFQAPALAALLEKASIRPVVNQIERHPLLPQWELLDYCSQHDIVLQAHTPLGQGHLLEVDDIRKCATDRATAHVLLQWNLQQGVAVVPKCSSIEHREEILSCLSHPPLEADTMATLNTIVTNNKKKSKRFVAPPFMFGSSYYSWGIRSPS